MLLNCKNNCMVSNFLVEIKHQKALSNLPKNKVQCLATNFGVINIILKLYKKIMDGEYEIPDFITPLSRNLI